MSDSHFPVLVLDVAVPVQEYRVEYTVVQKTDLPFIREFILRLLDLGSFTKDQIGKFIGLSLKETDVALTQLFNLNEVKVGESGAIELTSKSKQYFIGELENRPKINSLEELRKTFRFDVLGFTYVSSDKSSQLSHPKLAIKLSADPEKLSNSVDYAKRSFQRHFHQIHDEETFGHLRIEKPELYKVSNFTKQKQRFLRFNRAYGIDTERNALEVISNDEFLEEESVSEKLSQTLRDGALPSNVEAVAKLFDTFDFELGVNALKTGSLDATSFRIEAMRSESSNSQLKPIIGSLLLEDNWLLFKGLMEKHFDKKSSTNELTWIAPCDKYWGASSYQMSRLYELKKEYQGLDLKLWVPIPYRKDGKTKRFFTNNFNELKGSLYGFVEGFLFGVEELVILEDKFAFFICYLYQSENLLPIPVGFYTEDTKVVSGLNRHFQSYLKEVDGDFEEKGIGRLLTKNDNRK